MALALKLTATSRSQIIQLSQDSPVGYAEFDHTVGIASGHFPPPPLPGNKHGMSLAHNGIAILNHQYDIYFLTPAAPAPFILVAYDVGSHMTLVALKDRSTPLPWSDQHQKRGLAGEVAAGLRIFVTDVMIL